MAKIIEKWTEQAVEDLDSAYDYISLENPAWLKPTIESILSAIEQIKSFPETGREGRVKGTREFVISAIPFIIVYRNQKNAVEILSVLHQSRKWP